MQHNSPLAVLKRVGTRAVLAALALGLLSFNRAARAQEQASEAKPSPTPSGGVEPGFASVPGLPPRAGEWPAFTASADYAYVAPGKAEFQGAKRGDSQAQSLNASALATIPLNERWFMPVGVGSANLFLDSVSGMPIPEEIHTVRVQAGLGYRLDERWLLSASLGPTLYRVDDIDGNDFGIAGMVSATFRQRPDLRWVFGLGFNPDSDVPVLPAAGVRWDIRTNLTLNLMFPRPVLIYRVAPKLSVFAGGDIKFAVFRANEDQGSSIGQSRFNDALGTYRDFHLGLGAEYEFIQRLSVSVEGGYSVGRQIDYKRVDETVSFDPSPYCQVGLKYRF